MAYVPIPAISGAKLAESADARWQRAREARPDLEPALALQRQLLARVLEAAALLDGGRLPRLSLPSRYLAAKLGRGVPALAGEPIPLPVPALEPTLLRLCDALAAGGAGEAAAHVRSAIAGGGLDAASLLTASLHRDQAAVRTAAVHRGLSPDLLWLAAELAVSPFVHALQRLLLGGATADLEAALDKWDRGYCAACGSWPAVAEVVHGHRTLRCSFCAAAWDLPTYACIYCREAGEPFVTAAPDEERKDRRVEVCSACGGYLKTIDLPELSAFPLLSISDIETTDLDVAAMEHGYRRPALLDFARRAEGARG